MSPGEMTRMHREVHQLVSVPPRLRKRVRQEDGLRDPSACRGGEGVVVRW